MLTFPLRVNKRSLYYVDKAVTVPLRDLCQGNSKLPCVLPVLYGPVGFRMQQLSRMTLARATEQLDGNAVTHFAEAES